jgi:nucleotide-binding universal stress UspA family protein
MYKQILIAMDGSEISKKAAIQGIELAKKDGARVIGAHILDVEALNIMDVGSDEEARLKKHQREKGEEALSFLEELAKAKSVELEKIVKEGEPVKEIIKIADVHSVDLIVMGTHGRKGLRGVLDHETSEELAQEYPNCPIMVVM